jgi:hypothetical protein
MASATGEHRKGFSPMPKVGVVVPHNGRNVMVQKNPAYVALVKELIAAWQAMYEHTQPICAKKCGLPLKCCDPMGCETSRRVAASHWGVHLKETGHPTLPFMGKDGCTIKPHLRPLCTFHVCCISSMGFLPNDPVWTKEYFDLRNKIDAMETKKARYEGRLR